MWADLGMNLELHDMLCEVLPGAIGDVFMSQENRPAAMDYFDMVLADVHGLRPSELVEFRKNGGKVFGTFCAYVPDEVIFAAGGIATGLCAGSQFWVPGGERYLPANTCPLIKAMLGARFDRTCPFYRLADVYIGETTCDGKKKAYEILGTDVPLHVMDLPQMKREKDYHKWADEIKDLIKVVEETTSKRSTQRELHSRDCTASDGKRMFLSAEQTYCSSRRSLTMTILRDSQQWSTNCVTSSSRELQTV